MIREHHRPHPTARTMSIQLTRAEFYAKYGTAQVSFSSYYKYTFTYAGTLPDGKRLTVDFGGSGDDIYRHEVVSGSIETVSQLEPYAGAVYDGAGEVEGFYDY
jgi:hypothetical protein